MPQAGIRGESVLPRLKRKRIQAVARRRVHIAVRADWLSELARQKQILHLNVTQISLSRSRHRRVAGNPADDSTRFSPAFASARDVFHARCASSRCELGAPVDRRSGFASLSTALRRAGEPAKNSPIGLRASPESWPVCVCSGCLPAWRQSRSVLRVSLSKREIYVFVVFRQSACSVQQVMQRRQGVERGVGESPHRSPFRWTIVGEAEE